METAEACLSAWVANRPRFGSNRPRGRSRRPQSSAPEWVKSDLTVFEIIQICWQPLYITCNPTNFGRSVEVSPALNRSRDFGGGGPTMARPNQPRIGSNALNAGRLEVNQVSKRLKPEVPRQRKERMVGSTFGWAKVDQHRRASEVHGISLFSGSRVFVSDSRAAWVLSYLFPEPLAEAADTSPIARTSPPNTKMAGSRHHCSRTTFVNSLRTWPQSGPRCPNVLAIGNRQAPHNWLRQVAGRKAAKPAAGLVRV